ncbi:MAG: type III pantothenate kinase [Chitinophagales bacterium]
MINLCLDIGNTRLKAAIFNEKEELIYHNIFASFTKNHLEKIFANFNIQQAILSSVANHATFINTFLEKRTFFVHLTHNTSLPITNAYATPKTLGRDRLAVVVGGKVLFPTCDILAIDAGTCITYDFIDQKNVYHGGSISLGLQMRFRALQHFTDKLPLVNKTATSELIGKTTETAITSGVMQGTAAEMNGIIAQYRQKYPNIKVLLTGGDANFFETQAKSEIFVRQNLVLEGLNKILNYNATTQKQ